MLLNFVLTTQRRDYLYVNKRDGYDHRELREDEPSKNFIIPLDLHYR